MLEKCILKDFKEYSYKWKKRIVDYFIMKDKINFVQVIKNFILIKPININYLFNDWNNQFLAIQELRKILFKINLLNDKLRFKYYFNIFKFDNFEKRVIENLQNNLNAYLLIKYQRDI